MVRARAPAAGGTPPFPHGTVAVAMDSVTQILLGTAIAEAGFRKDLGWRAVLAGAAFGVLPDLDIVSRLAGPWAMLRHHRGETHSLIVLALAAPLLGWLAWRWTGRRAPRRRWMHLAFWVLLTHPLLDLCTSYGTQLLWPVTGRRFSIDAIAIIDPVYTVPLFAALVLACVPRIRRFSRGFAIVALALTTAYLAFGRVEMHRARSLASEQLTREGFEAVEVRATPMLLSTDLLWHVVGRDREGNLRVGTVSTWAPREIRFQRIDRPGSPLVGSALESERGRLFAWFADGLVGARVEREGPHTVVVLSDHRYGMVTDPAVSVFTARARFDAGDRLVDVELTHGDRDMDFGREIRTGWKLLKGEPIDREE
ncbi:MAG TPA: metal-dependent hydrolase [Planctomycetota bacterium]|nr:metal-dependent hydrolase [Planctomycetota bacterium]